ncbi:hypothetical protein HMPREF9946_03126 [Acetobacteraceae bacterium AT-5844]|nr:hypothetical protein HMPREF9946_03126 [Acetobacteraceae bacterium AT-5844]
MTDADALDLVELHKWSVLPTPGGRWVVLTDFGATEPFDTVREAIRAALSKHVRGGLPRG